MDMRIRLLSNVLGRVLTTRHYRPQKSAFLYLAHHKSSMVERSQQDEDLAVAPIKEKSTEVEIQGPMRHLLRGQGKTTQIQRVSFFRGKVEQKIDKLDIIAFENALVEEKNKQGFISVVYKFMDRDRLRRGHLSFLYTALNYMMFLV